MLCFQTIKADDNVVEKYELQNGQIVREIIPAGEKKSMVRKIYQTAGDPNSKMLSREWMKD